MVYHNAGNTLGPILDSISGSQTLSAEQQQAVESLSKNMKPTVVTVYGEPQRVSVATNSNFLDFSVGRSDSPQLFGWSLPRQWSANLLYRASSGVRYTELILDSNGNSNESLDTNGKIGPTRSYLNLKINKYWDLPNHNRFTMFLEARNVLDQDNYRRVNPWTGEGYHLGNWDGSIAADRKNAIPKSVNSVWYGEDFVDPSYRTDPRTVLMGVSYGW